MYTNIICGNKESVLSNINGSGGKTPTSELIDLFPMADGKKPTESEYDYHHNKFFMNRDPRFYRTFCIPGCGMAVQ